jgi:hypothetical protein
MVMGGDDEAYPSFLFLRGCTMSKWGKMYEVFYEMVRALATGSEPIQQRIANSFISRTVLPEELPTELARKYTEALAKATCVPGTGEGSRILYISLYCHLS